MDSLVEHEDVECEELTPRRIDSLLAKRSRKSFPKACYPCRRRKVRCDHKHPCGNCIKHEQPELCVYFDQEGKSRKDDAVSKPAARSTKDRLEAIADLERRMQTMAEEVVRRLGPLSSGLAGQLPAQHQSHRNTSASAPSFQEESPRDRTHPNDGLQTSATNGEIGMSTHIGAESLASTLIQVLNSGQSWDSPSQSSNGGGTPQPSALETMKLLYMTDTGSTHPFKSLWKPGATVEEICLALPDDEIFEQ